METGDWIRSTWTDAGQLMALIATDGEPGAAKGQALTTWYAQLVADGDLDTAIEFLGHALPRYECVVWAVQALLDIGAADRHDPLMVTILRWIDDPDDARRRLAGEAAEAVRQTTAPRLLGEAVFLSGGSLAPEGVPAVQPPADACAKLATSAILVGAYGRPDPAAALRKALTFGEDMVTRQ